MVESWSSPAVAWSHSLSARRRMRELQKYAMRFAKKRPRTINSKREYRRRMVMSYLSGYSLSPGALPSIFNTLVFLLVLREEFRMVTQPGRLATRFWAAESDSAVLGALTASPRRMRPIQYCLY